MSSGPYKFTFKRACLEAESECGSLGELASILTDEGSALVKMFGSDMELVVQSLGGNVGQAGPEREALPGESNAASDAKEPGEAPKERKPRGPNKPKAEAPAPIAIPGTGATVDMTPNANGIPAGLARDPVTNTAPAIAAPPPVAAPPPPAPSGVLAGKIIAEMDRRVAGSPEAPQAMANWLGTTGITVAGATYAEACDVIRLQSDDRLSPIAVPLGIAA